MVDLSKDKQDKRIINKRISGDFNKIEEIIKKRKKKKKEKIMKI